MRDGSTGPSAFGEVGAGADWATGAGGGGCTTEGAAIEDCGAAGTTTISTVNVAETMVAFAGIAEISNRISARHRWSPSPAFLPILMEIAEPKLFDG